MSSGPDQLFDLLPAHLRARDEESGGALRALLSVVADELALVSADLDALYDGWFAETCAEWLLPYVADLVGLDEVPPDLGPAVSRRAVVANTVAYRRRKGTVAVLEQVTRDVTGWPTRAVETFRLLATSAHLNHPHRDRPATAGLRCAGRLDLAGAAVDLRSDRSTPPPELVDLTRGGLDPLAHTVEARRIAVGRGRYGIPNIAVFVFPLQTYVVGTGRGPAAAWAQARAAGGGFSVDPLGRHTPLFATPRPEDGIEHLATEEDLPLPLRPRRLLALLQAARRGGLAEEDLPVGVRLGRDADPLPAQRLRVCGLEELDPGADPQVCIDAVSGTLWAFRDGAAFSPDSVRVRYGYGGTADVGAGPYDRADVHEQVVAADRYDGGADAVGQVGVLAGVDPSELGVGSVAEGLQRAEQAWTQAGPGSAAGATYVVSIGDSASYVGDLSVTIPAATRLILVAASWPVRVLPGGEIRPQQAGGYVPDGLRPHVRGTVTVTGGPGSSMVLDGVVLDGDLVVAPGKLGALSVAQCTLGGGLRVAATADDPNGDLRVHLTRTLATTLDLAPTVPELTVTDSVLDAGAGPALTGDGLHAGMEGTTVRGGIAVRTLDASSCVLDGTVVVENRQTGCVRYSFVPLGARVPRRFRCVPAEGLADVAPVYAAHDPGSPQYLALADYCPQAIREGGEGDAEMGVHHHLRRPPRVRAARRQLDSYLPVGLEIAILGSGHAG